MPSVIGWAGSVMWTVYFDAVVAGVGDPLAAGHELPLGVVAERVAHAAVTAGDADAARPRRARA